MDSRMLFDRCRARSRPTQLFHTAKSRCVAKCLSATLLAVLVYVGSCGPFMALAITGGLPGWLGALVIGCYRPLFDIACSVEVLGNNGGSLVLSYVAWWANLLSWEP